MKKKIAGFALALSIAVSMAIPAAAAGNVEIPSNNGRGSYTEYVILDAEQKGKITLGEDFIDEGEPTFLSGQYDLFEVAPGKVIDLTDCYYATFMTLNLVDGTLYGAPGLASDEYEYNTIESDGPWWSEGSGLSIFKEGYYLVAAWHHDPMAKSEEETTGLARVLHVTSDSGTAAPTPAAPAPAVPAKPAAAEVYTVKAGDTLAQLALNYYGSYKYHEELAKVNADVLKKNGYSLFVGMKLNLPEKLGEVSKLAAQKPAEGEKLYTVKMGDTLGTIAKAAYGDSSMYKAIFEHNADRLKNADSIYEGQIIILPAQ